MLIEKLIGEAIPESGPTYIDFPMNKLIGEAIPETEPVSLLIRRSYSIDFLIDSLRGDAIPV